MLIGNKPLNIKDAEVYQLARELASLTGKSLTDVVRHSLQDRLPRQRWSGPDIFWFEPLREISDRCAARPVLDTRSDVDLVGYDDKGFPQCQPN